MIRGVLSLGGSSQLVPVLDGKRRFHAELTGLRGVAIAIIVLGHFLQRVHRFHSGGGELPEVLGTLFGFLTTPFSGCCIFFSISGYSLFSYLDNRRSHGQTPAIGAYLFRRLLKLCPPYFGVLLITYIFLVSTGFTPVGAPRFDQPPSSLTESLLYSLFLSHWVAFGSYPRLFPPGWFIEVQFQFYLIAPLLYSLYLRITPTVRRLQVGYTLLPVLMALIPLAIRYGPPNTGCSLVVFVPYFWFGAIFADLRYHGPRSLFGRRVWAWPPLGWCALGAFILIGGATNSQSFLDIGRLVCLAIIFKVSFINDNGFHRLLANRYLAWAGRACYSIYLVHLQVLQIVTPLVTNHLGPMPFWVAAVACAVVCLPAVVIASAVFYWCFERPCLHAAARLSSKWFPDRTDIAVPAKTTLRYPAT